MAITAEFIGVYIADIITTATLIATTVTITVIVTVATITITAATIITITAIGKTYRVVAVAGQGSQHTLAAFSFFRPGAFPCPHVKNCYDAGWGCWLRSAKEGVTHGYP